MCVQSSFLQPKGLQHNNLSKAFIQQTCPKYPLPALFLLDRIVSCQSHVPLVAKLTWN